MVSTAMDERLLALALEKQRLRSQSADLRAELAQHARGIAPLFAVVDRVHTVARWLRAHPEASIAVAIGLTLLRPRLIWRWGRRGFLLWQGWRRLVRWASRPTVQQR